jgi:hypothetical protein
VRAAWIAALVLAATPAAAKFRRPFRNDVGLNAGFDSNRGAAGCRDAMCGGNCYDNHTGNDFNVGIGNDALAAADGTVTEAVQGCPDIGYYCSPCGGQCGNHVRIAHPDGTSSLICHMQNGSLAVGVGQHVSCGQFLGHTASSGCSTGPHLHFGWIRGGAVVDPYSGPCAAGGGWVDQGQYGRSPTPDCENHCECNPGDVQEEGCGNCGRHRRGCGGDCHWGGWGGCEGQGPCGPGQVDTQACCDCGTQQRVCGGDCQWGGWGACGGPDPPGPPACPTGIPGDCATGAERCVGGCLACVQTVFPSPEKCDDHDNDCDGPTDEDATELSDPPPRFAAQLEDLSAPEALLPGERATVWAVFRNVGTQPWPGAGTWLGARGPGDDASPLRDPDAWSGYDAAAGVPQSVPPGGTVRLQFPVRMSAAGEVSTRFDMAVQGRQVMCPAPGFDLDPVRIVPSFEGVAPDAGDDDAPAPRAETTAGARDDGGCAGTPVAPLLVLLAALRRRRRA